MAIKLNDNIETNAPKPSDSRYFNNLTPWVDIIEVNAGISLTTRFQGLTVNIAGVEYRYKDGIADEDLVEKETAGGEGTPQEIDYGQIRVLDQGVQVNLHSRAIGSKVFGSKDILTQNSTVNPVYFTCVWDIYEEDQFNTINVHRGIQFVDEADLRTWMGINLSQTAGIADYNVRARIYDVVDEAIPSPRNMGYGNVMFQTYRGRHTGNKSMPCLQSISSGTVFCSPTEYASLVEGAVNRLPGMSGYIWTDGDLYNELLWFPKSRKNFYNLLNDEATVYPTNTRRCWRESDQSLQQIGASFRVLHSESYYVARNLTGGTVTFYDKEDFYNIQSINKDGSLTLVILYKVHYTDGVENYYGYFMKPVGVDQLYMEGFDTAKYEAFAFIEQTGVNPRKRLLPFEVSSQGIKWKARLPKYEYLCYTQLMKGTRRKSALPNPKLKFFLRDNVTGKISKLSKQSFVFKNGRDRPLMPMLVN